MRLNIVTCVIAIVLDDSGNIRGSIQNQAVLSYHFKPKDLSRGLIISIKKSHSS